MCKEKSYKTGILEAPKRDLKSQLRQVIKNTPVQPLDFDAKAFRLLDALSEKGRALEAGRSHLTHTYIYNMYMRYSEV